MTGVDRKPPDATSEKASQPPGDGSASFVKKMALHDSR